MTQELETAFSQFKEGVNTIVENEKIALDNSNFWWNRRITSLSMQCNQQWVDRLMAAVFPHYKKGSVILTVSYRLKKEEACCSLNQIRLDNSIIAVQYGKFWCIFSLGISDPEPRSEIKEKRMGINAFHFLYCSIEGVTNFDE